MIKNNYSKKLLVGLMAVCILFMPFSGCGAANTHGLSKGNPTSISIWHYYNGPQQQAFDALVNKFNESVGDEMGIVVQHFSQGSVTELTEKALDSLNQNVGAEEYPDILTAYADTAYEFYKQDKVADIRQYLTDEEYDSFVPEYWDEGKFSDDGTFRLFPVAKATEVMTLNETDWEPFAQATGVTEADLTTWEGLVQVSEKYYQYTDGLTPETEDDGKAFFGRDAMANYLLVGSMQLGTEIFSVTDEAVTYQVNRDAMRRLWDNYYVPFVNGWFTASGRFRSDDAKTGELIACVGSTSGSMYFPTEVTMGDGTVYPITAKVLPLPNFLGTEPYAVQQGAGMMITKSEEKKEYASSVFLKWFTEPENNLQFCLNSGYLPVKTAANDVALIRQALEADGSVDVGDGEQEGSALYQTLTTGVKMTKTYHMYTNRAFENGTKARGVLESLLSDWASNDRKEIDKLVEQGNPRSEAVAQYTTDENFEQWFSAVETSLQNVG